MAISDFTSLVLLNSLFIFIEFAMKKPKREDHDKILQEVALLFAKQAKIEEDFPGSLKEIHEKHQISRGELFRIRHQYPSYLNTLIAKAKARLNLTTKPV